MKISTDGGHTWVEVEALRVSQELQHEDAEAEVTFNFTSEGLIIDAWADGYCQGTSSETYLEIGDRLVDGE